MENKEIKYCLCTEGTDKTFAHLRVMLSSFLKNNPWFNGDIVINTFNITPLSKQNMETLQKLDDRILFREADSSIYRATLNGLNRRARNNKRIDTMSELIYCYSFEAFELDEYDAVLYINHLSLILGDVSKLMSSDADLVSVIESNVFNDAVENHPRTTDKSHTINSNIMLLSSNILKSDMGKRVKTHLLSVRSFNQNTHKKLVSAQVSRSEFPIKLLSNNIYSKKTFFPDKKSDDLKSSIRDIAALELNAGVFGTTRNFHGMGYKAVDKLWMKESEGVIDKLYGKEGLDIADKMSQYVGSFRTRKSRPLPINKKRRDTAHAKLAHIKLSNDLLSYVKGKRVCIVGPSANLIGKGYGALIDSYDIVIRFNGSYPIPKDKQLDYGSKTNIIYINNFFVKKTGKSNVSYLNTKVDFIVSKASITGTVRLKSGSSFGSRLMGNIAIADILNYSPGEIYVTGIDFYKTRGNFKDNYHDPRYFGEKFNPKPGSVHNMEFNINDLRNMHKNNIDIIKIDDTLHSILYK